jgi:hypothetical protein
LIFSGAEFFSLEHRLEVELVVIGEVALPLAILSVRLHQFLLATFPTLLGFGVGINYLKNIFLRY